MWPIRGCAAGMGVVFVISVLNRVYNFAQDCPKQGNKIEGFALNREKIKLVKRVAHSTLYWLR